MDIGRPSPNVDEGFSEDTRSPADSEMMFAVESSDTTVSQLLQMVLTLPAETRRYFTLDLIRSLSNPDKEVAKALIEDLTHFDPAAYCPSEIMLQILSYLSPRDLLTASLVSRAWRSKSQDERLWQCCFAREGWVLDKPRMQAYERKAEKKSARIAAGNLTQPAGLARRGSRKRKTEEAFSEGEAARPSGAGGMAQAVDGFASDDRREYTDEMEGVESSVSGATSFASALDGSTPAADLLMGFSSRRSSLSSSGSGDIVPTPLDFKLRPTLFQDNTLSQPRLSWPYLYKQRRKLETNWDKGLFKPIQIPHRDHQEEGHDECVYTIQHTSRHLVSGSRDRTIRIWDLDTCRLKLPPLRGHDLSVLCLQFDERPEHDIIVSGGSDAHVIIWKFSTGEMVRMLDNAHDESVLNLRFDDRYIVTCSKDKTIKIWNRHALRGNDPLIPSHVIDKFRHPNGPADPIEEFTLLATLAGHHAAVNAVMIHENTIVSASGDRTIRAWDIDTGVHQKTYSGHIKGIACVQFDGRRIVSGSSDNTVRIFDADKQAEIACLTGHMNLVRTVQARFGDLATTTNEELAEEARKADRALFKALTRGMPPAAAGRRAPRNAGSSRPEDMQTYGARIPPGGGGSRWAKIVSGSYDETVILWKRDYEGKWQVRHRLHQEMLPRRGARRQQVAAPQPNHHPPAAAAAAATQVGTASTQIAAAAQNHVATATARPAPSSSAGPSATAQHAAAQPTPSAPTGGNANSNANANRPPGRAAAQPPPHPQQQQQQQPPPAAQHPPQAPVHHRDNNRVFKLQFDARRILCCSQNKTIVGWDFANGDKELERIGDWSVETA